MDLDTDSSKNKGKVKASGFKLNLIKAAKWIPAVVIVCISWYLSGKPRLEHLPTFRNADKVVHFFCFGMLSFWVAFGCNIKTYKRFYIPTAIVSLYGFIDEIHQSFTPGRSCSVFDWCADTLGAVAGAVFFVWICRWIEKFSIKK
ncbi:MAG: VanZ family protein [Treponema sp.]|uniref:VanZ family protein n=1 Tax=Treponema sp. TaxID=166 RepID=UPI001B5B31B9|nr:VanZ family protein [Treponema sp.]MBP5403044.1 VanZ family protein [Treponema sp.]MBR5934263.1 VanZ family protein [Treponema sp.]